MSRAKSQAKKRRGIPRDALRCTAETSAGSRCRNARQHGGTTCHWHSGRAAESGKKGADALAAKAAERRRVRAEARAMFACEDFDDLIGLIADRVVNHGDPPIQWGRLLFDCFKETKGHNVIYYVVPVDPLAPEDYVPALPELPVGDPEPQA